LRCCTEVKSRPENGMAIIYPLYSGFGRGPMVYGWKPGMNLKVNSIQVRHHNAIL